MSPFAHIGPDWVDRPWWNGFAWLMPLLFVGLVAIVAVWAVSRMTRQPPMPAMPGAPPVPPAPAHAPRPDAALELARLRYARGEMGRDEYLQVTRDLGGPAESPGEDSDA